MGETYGRSTNALPESDQSNMSVSSNQRKLRKIPKGRGSVISMVQALDNEGYDRMIPMKPKPVNTNTKPSPAGCLSCFGMGSTNKGATLDKSNG